jgi:hypothetical protein
VKELALQEKHTITETIENSFYFYKIYRKHLAEAHKEQKERERERESNTSQSQKK